MAQIPMKTGRSGRWRRFFAWFGRHKVLAVFVVLVLALAGYLGGSEIVLRVQIHAERARFTAVQADMVGINKKLNRIGALQFKRYCFYSSSTAEFTRGDRLCTVRSIINLDGATQGGAQDAATYVKGTLERQGLRLMADSNSRTDQSIIVDSFNDEGISCSFDSEYYSESVPDSARAQPATKTGNTLLIDIACSGGAKAEYFPVTDN